MLTLLLQQPPPRSRDLCDSFFRYAAYSASGDQSERAILITESQTRFKALIDCGVSSFDRRPRKAQEIIAFNCQLAVNGQLCVGSTSVYQYKEKGRYYKERTRRKEGKWRSTLTRFSQRNLLEKAASRRPVLHVPLRRTRGRPAAPFRRTDSAPVPLMLETVSMATALLRASCRDRACCTRRRCDRRCARR